MPDEAVKVAVRVRPFNQREKDRRAKLVIEMQGQMTVIRNPDAQSEEPKKFSFDYSYWSHNGFTTGSDGILTAEAASNYASQRKVFDDLGQGVLDNAFEGYNCSLFAYGQTGSGKSYSMVGYGPNKGIVPIICDELFKAIEKNGDSNKRFTVSFSMLEIYNEQVRDLLSKDNPKGGLQVRQNPSLGLFYVQGLKKVPVGSYKEIEKRMDQGTAVRTVASTNMNATSSRAHTVVTITFDQFTKGASGESKKSSVMNLVDLAGSERADSTGATGDRLKEGANINKSLSALGNVISALADMSSGKKKNVMVPYRDSVLTKLLQNALGGNSKTVMIAALSPADINYDETLSTLRYADRAKQIKNKAVVNENPMDRLIRELKEENDRLRKQLMSGNLPDASVQGMSPEEIEKMRSQMMEEIKAQLMANQKLLTEEEEEKSADAWEKQLQLARSETIVQETTSTRRTRDPHLLNLNEDPMLTGVVFHYLGKGDTTIGRKDSDTAPTVCLSGLSISKNHAIITNNGGEIEITPAMTGAKTKVNGSPLIGTRILEHKDRVLFGSNHLYVLINPLKPDSSQELPPEITWEFAQKEIAQAKGFMQSSMSGMTKDQQIAQEQVLEILPMVSEVNAISEELNKYCTFEVVLISQLAQEGRFGQENSTLVSVKMKNLLSGNCWLWERGKFMNRRYLMQDMYQRFLDGEDDDVDVSKEEDPFWEPPEDVLIGTANVYLENLAYGLDYYDKMTVSDYKGSEEGEITVHVTPCSQAGRYTEEEFFVEDPSDLINKPYNFKVTIEHARVSKARYSRGLHIKYRVYKDDTYTETETMKGTLEPAFKHSKIFSYQDVTEDHINFFSKGRITFLLYGVQEETLQDPKLLKMTTRELRQMEAYQGPSIERKKTMFHLDPTETGQLKSEILLLKKKFERLEQKEKRMQELCREWKAKRSGEQSFDGFHRAVSAVAFSTGTKLKTRVQILNKIIQAHKVYANGWKWDEADDWKSKKPEDDLVSLYVFGEEEARLSAEAQRNQGILNHRNVVLHYGKEQADELLASQRRATGSAVANGSSISPVPPGVKGRQTDGAGDKKEGSKACVIQ